MADPANEISSPAVHFPPPLLFVVAIASGWAIERSFPMPLSAMVSVPAEPIISWGLICIGASLMIWGLATFKLAKTAVYPNQPAAELVARGPYRFSRNPMYVGLTVMTIGIGLRADNVWMLLMLPVILTVLSKFVIQREERYLQHAFGASYLDYQKRVRRWL